VPVEWWRATGHFWWLLTGVLGHGTRSVRSNPARATAQPCRSTVPRFLQKPDTRASARLGDDLEASCCAWWPSVGGKRMEIQSLCEVVDAAPRISNSSRPSC
jgi:hypothetical protein